MRLMFTTAVMADGSTLQLQIVVYYRVSPIIRQGLYYFLFQSMALGLIFGGCIILIYQKMKCVLSPFLFI